MSFYIKIICCPAISLKCMHIHNIYIKHSVIHLYHLRKKYFGSSSLARPVSESKRGELYQIKMINLDLLYTRHYTWTLTYYKSLILIFKVQVVWLVFYDFWLNIFIWENLKKLVIDSLVNVILSATLLKQTWLSGK